jgi:hypothetical protein
MLVLGAFLPGKYLIYYLILWPAVIIHWSFNDSNCMLTELESQLSESHFNKNIPGEMIHYKYINVFQIFKKFNIHFDTIDTLTSYFHNTYIICWVIGLIRLLNYHKKSIYSAWLSIKKHLGKRLIHDRYK